MTQDEAGAQSLREVDFLPQDEGLRADVSRLGALVGDVLAEQEGEAFFTRVERLRRAAIRRREADAPMDELARSLEGLEPELAQTLTRAFSTYFQVVNLAEQVHRIRRRRDYQRRDAGPQPEGLEASLAALRDAGVAADAVAAMLAALDVEPVFTAHPTEAVRRSLLEKEQEMARCLIAGFDAARPRVEREREAARLRMALTAGWQTSEASPERPSVQDEFEHVGFYLVNPIYRVLPLLYENLAAAWSKVWDEPLEPPRVLRFASWVGGDMDGNPNVGADTIGETLEAQRVHILARYRRECAHLAGLLSQTRRRVRFSAELEARLAAYLARFPSHAELIRPRHRDMPYRCLLQLMEVRLKATEEDGPGRYVGPDELEDDVACIRASLLAHGGARAGAFAVTRLLWRVRSFGFHLARLDVRQDARVQDDVLALLLADPGWAARPAAERAARLHAPATGEARLPPAADPEPRRLHAVFAALATARQRYGARATGPWVISMARSAADVLAVLALARWGALVDARGAVPLDIAPLFETVADLEGAAENLRALLVDPVYRAHLATRGDRQLVMLGYSDSAKDGGIISSRWLLQNGQTAMLEVARAAGVQLDFFHGRGGSTSRGGGKLVRALEAAPAGSVHGRLRLTEQGEVIQRNYGLRALALRSMEQMVGATLRASLREPAPVPTPWAQVMGAMAAASRAAYRALVRDPDFVAWFRAATPIDVIERMAMSSRPASRRAMKGVTDLRAIPWVFAWTQSRSILTGWYGLGTALEAAIAAHGLETLQAMHAGWPFLRTLIADVEMVLAKTDLRIARRFSRLAGPLHERFFTRVEAEHARAVAAILALKQADALLADDPRLALSIRLRNPYIDPMSLIQVDLLRRWRAAGSPAGDPLLAALVASVNGVARGLQNTG